MSSGWGRGEGQGLGQGLGISTAGLTLPEIAPRSTQHHTPGLWGGRGKRRRVYLWPRSPRATPHSHVPPRSPAHSPW